MRRDSFDEDACKVGKNLGTTGDGLTWRPLEKRGNIGYNV